MSRCHLLPLRQSLLPLVLVGLAIFAWTLPAPSAAQVAHVPDEMAGPVAHAPLPLPGAQPLGNWQVASFRAAKTLLTILYAEHPYTLYSGCHFDAVGKVVDYGHCAYQPVHPSERAARIEWEHIVPAETFGHAFAEWRTGDPSCVDGRGPYRGRRCASRASAAFRRIEADLYNLVPEVGELNQRRSNKPMDEVLPTECEPLAGIGGCVARQRFMPRPEVKGDVARTHLYMAAAYPELQLLSGKKRLLFAAWSLQDPVDAWECRRAYRIEGLQGNENLPVKHACQAAHLWPELATYSHQ